MLLLPYLVFKEELQHYEKKFDHIGSCYIKTIVMDNDNFKKERYECYMRESDEAYRKYEYYKSKSNEAYSNGEIYLRSAESHDYYGREFDDEIHISEAREDREKAEMYFSEAREYQQQADEYYNKYRNCRLEAQYYS